MSAITLERALSIAAAVKPETRAFIGGEYVGTRSGATFTSVNPATGEPIAEVAHCMGEDVDAAVRAARAAFGAGSWSRAAPEERKAVLLKLAALVREHKEELAVLESLDSGKTINDCLHEIGNEVANFFQWYAELIDKAFGKVAPTGEQALALARGGLAAAQEQEAAQTDTGEHHAGRLRNCRDVNRICRETAGIPNVRPDDLEAELDMARRIVDRSVINAEHSRQTQRN